jgi:hypothetical protein
MAWGQQDAFEAWRFVAERPPTPSDTGRSERERRCAGCTSVILGHGVMFRLHRYCSTDCVVEDTRARALPGNYLG